ncbi:MAG: YkoF family thiamine/hydroxymethylpyrimidine-binding protein [Bacteroidota bacterium]
MSKAKVVAQFTFIPLYTENPEEKIDRLLEMAAQNDVEMEVNDLSTTVRGDYSDILDLMREIYETMAMEGVKFRFHVEMLSPITEDNV